MYYSFLWNEHNFSRLLSYGQYSFFRIVKLCSLIYSMELLIIHVLSFHESTIHLYVGFRQF